MPKRLNGDGRHQLHTPLDRSPKNGGTQQQRSLPNDHQFIESSRINVYIVPNAVSRTRAQFMLFPPGTLIRSEPSITLTRNQNTTATNLNGRTSVLQHRSWSSNLDSSALDLQHDKYIPSFQQGYQSDVPT